MKYEHYYPVDISKVLYYFMQDYNSGLALRKEKMLIILKEIASCTDSYYMYIKKKSCEKIRLYFMNKTNQFKGNRTNLDERTYLRSQTYHITQYVKQIFYKGLHS